MLVLCFSIFNTVVSLDFLESVFIINFENTSTLFLKVFLCPFFSLISEVLITFKLHHLTFCHPSGIHFYYFFTSFEFFEQFPFYDVHIHWFFSHLCQTWCWAHQTFIIFVIANFKHYLYHFWLSIVLFMHDEEIFILSSTLYIFFKISRFINHDTGTTEATYFLLCGEGAILHIIGCLAVFLFIIH